MTTMARPWRIQYEGAIYHVMSKGVGRGKIFLADDDYSRFLEYMASARKMFNLEIFGVGISAVNKAALRISMRSKTSESFRKKMERTVYSLFKV